MIYDVTTKEIDANRIRDVFQEWKINHSNNSGNDDPIIILSDDTLQWLHEHNFNLDLRYRIYTDNIRKFGEFELR